MAKDPYQEVTDRILEALDAGVVPWVQPWRGGLPANLVSGKDYRGVNTYTLTATALVRGYSSRYWVTFRQARKRGGHVRKGERGTPVVFWRFLDREDRDPDTGKIETKRIPLLQYFTVFNLGQCEDVEAPAEETREVTEIPRCADVVAGMPNPPAIRHGGGRACYSPASDVVSMPPQPSFVNDPAYYSVLYHELTHSTGHPSRLDREGIRELEGFGSHSYGREELIAEMSAAFLCAATGIEVHTEDRAASYIESWRQTIKADKKLVVRAAGRAAKAVDFILDRKREDQDQGEDS